MELHIKDADHYLYRITPQILLPDDKSYRAGSFQAGYSPV